MSRETDLFDVVPCTHECVDAGQETFRGRGGDISQRSSQCAPDVALKFICSCGGLPVEEKLVGQARECRHLSLRWQEWPHCGDILFICLALKPAARGRRITGMVIPITAVKTSGRSRAASYANWVPQSCLTCQYDHPNINIAGYDIWLAFLTQQRSLLERRHAPECTRGH